MSIHPAHRCAALLGVAVLVGLEWALATAPAGASRGGLACAAIEFLESLSPQQCEIAKRPLSDPDRDKWSYLRGERGGISWGTLTEPQRDGVREIVSLVLSNSGAEAIETVRTLEGILHQQSIESGSPDHTFNPNNYFVRIWGEPGTDDWLFRYEGHHAVVQLATANWNLTPFPLFLGAKPTEAKIGERSGVRNLGAQQDAGFKLWSTLSAEQLAGATLAGCPGDIVSGPGRERSLAHPVGVPASALDEAQQAVLWELIASYTGMLRDEFAREELERMRTHEPGTIHFAVAGDCDRKKPHYFRIHGPVCLIEFACSGGDPDHLHTVWHDPSRGFANDILAEHHQTHHAGENDGRE